MSKVLIFLILHMISENFLYFCELKNLKVVWQAMIYAVIACTSKGLAEPRSFFVLE